MFVNDLNTQTPLVLVQVSSPSSEGSNEGFLAHSKKGSHRRFFGRVFRRAFVGAFSSSTTRSLPRRRSRETTSVNVHSAQRLSP